MSDFKFKGYQKIDGDEHIEQRLQKDHVEEQNTIEENQLEDYREEELNVVLEKSLEKKRLNQAASIIERELDTAKEGLVKHRNPEAYSGDINKIEEQRLSQDRTEDEKYESAAETPKKLRWWEEKSSPDGLKLASQTPNKRFIHAYQEEELEFSEHKWDEYSKDSDEEGEHKFDDNDDLTLDDFGMAQNNVNEDYGIKVLKQTDITGALPGIYIKFSFDPDEYDGNVNEITDAIMKKIDEIKPEILGLISQEDIRVREDNATLRVVGPEFASIIDTGDISDSIMDGPIITETNFKESKIDGTPVVFGEISISTENRIFDTETLIPDILDYIDKRHPNLEITENHLNLSRLYEEGIISYATSPMKSKPKSTLREEDAWLREELPSDISDEDFPINDVS